MEPFALSPQIVLCPDGALFGCRMSGTRLVGDQPLALHLLAQQCDQRLEMRDLFLVKSADPTL